MEFDKIYNDFTTQVLPKISEGLTMTKDYALDLLGRYINYLIVTDTITLVATILLSLGIIILYRVIWKKSKDFNSHDKETYRVWCWVIGVMLLFITLSVVLQSGTNLIQDLLIPEIRVYQEFWNNFNK